jgi:hypothetical protein
VDYIDKFCNEIPINSNDIFKDKLSLYYPMELLDNNKINKIKNLYIEVTGNVEKVKIYNKTDISINRNNFTLNPISPVKLK